MELSVTGTFYSTLTGLALAAFYMLNKKTAHAGKALPVILWIFVCHLPIFLFWALWQPPSHIEPIYFVPGTIVVLLTIAGNLLTIRALSLSPFSLMIPVLGLSPVFTALIGIPLLHEWPSSIQWLGILLAVLGVLWLYAPPERPWDVLSFWSGFLKERGALCITLAALMWALAAPMDKISLRHADPQFHALYVFTGFVIALTIAFTLRGGFSDEPIARRHWPLIAFTGAVGGLSYILQLFALQVTPAGPFEAIKRVMSQFLAVLLGYFFFEEKITKPKLIGIVILSIGVPLIVI
jgi:drug/metabolite transporter (DMT)-like permease